MYIFLGESLPLYNNYDPHRGEWWCTALVFSLLIFVYDELRKLIIRNYPGGTKIRLLSHIKTCKVFGGGIVTHLSDDPVPIIEFLT